MSAVSHADSVRRGADPDSHIVKLGELILSRAPELGEALADRLFREIDAYHDGTVVTKSEVAASCEANLAFVFDSLAGHTDVDVSVAEHTGATRALAGVPLPALMTARASLSTIYDKGRAPGCLTPNAWLHPGNELCSTPTDARVMRYQEIGDASPSTASRPAYCGD